MLELFQCLCILLVMCSFILPSDPTGVRKNVYLFAGIQKNCSASAVLCNNEYMHVKRIADAKSLFTSMSSEWPSMAWYVTDPYVADLSPCSIPDDEAALHFSPSSLCFLQYTSGSTSFPKGVMITIANLRNNMDTIIRSLHADSSAVVVSWLPQYHDMGLIGSSLCLLYISLFSGLRSFMTLWWKRHLLLSHFFYRRSLSMAFANLSLPSDSYSRTQLWLCLGSSEAASLFIS